MTTSPQSDPIWHRIEASFNAQTMMSTLGARLILAEPGMVRIEAPILPGTRQQQGFGHAGLTFSIGDSAAGYAALSTMPADVDVVTAEIKMNLLAPARGERLVAEGRVIQAGRRLVVVQADVWAEDGDRRKKIALLQGTMIPV